MKRNRFKLRAVLLAIMMCAVPVTAASCAALPSAGEIGISVGKSLLEQLVFQALCHGQPINVCLGLG